MCTMLTFWSKKQVTTQLGSISLLGKTLNLDVAIKDSPSRRG